MSTCKITTSTSASTMTYISPVFPLTPFLCLKVQPSPVYNLPLLSFHLVLLHLYIFPKIYQCMFILVVLTSLKRYHFPCSLLGLIFLLTCVFLRFTHIAKVHLFYLLSSSPLCEWTTFFMQKKWTFSWKRREVKVSRS